MQKFDRFYFEWFEFDKVSLKARFFYSFDKIEKFVEEINFTTDLVKIRDDFYDEIMNNFLFSLSLAIWVSYYKAFPTKELVVESWFLTDEDKLFWQKFYRNWLWEFLYTNNLSPKWLFSFVNASERKYKKIEFTHSEKSLLPIGWGKDSIVSAEILTKNNLDFTPIIFWKSDVIKENCLKVMWKDSILINRKIDENLFKLNEKGYYNWHVPITWIIAFVLYTTAYLYDFKYIILSNEKSANVGNTKILVNSEKWIENNLEWQKLDNWQLVNGNYLEINHQYSKSLEFEQDLDNYVKRNLSDEITYFSLLRWMYEIKIADIFSKVWKKYFWVFSSCNNNFRIKKEVSIKSWIWCNECPKCAFVYSILRPFITKEENLQIFWKELYEDEKLENTFRELLWISWIKPFECVWEEDEVIYAMNLQLEKLKKEGENLPFILQIFEKEVKSKYDESYFLELENKLFKIYIEETLISEKFKIYE